MKREIMELRRILLEVEAAAPEPKHYGNRDTKEGYHAWLLMDGGYLTGALGVRPRAGDPATSPWYQDYEDDRVCLLTTKGHDLLDQLRDEDAVRRAMARCVGFGFDRDFLWLVLEIMNRDGNQPIRVQTKPWRSLRRFTADDFSAEDG